MNTMVQFDIRTSMKLQKYKKPMLDKILMWITKSANGGLIWIATGLLLLGMPGYRKSGILFLSVLTVTAIINNLILKSIFMRKRPCDLFQRVPLLIKRPHGSSFPSGHTAVSFACAAALCVICLPVGIAAMCLASIIGFTRVYFFVHFPTDVFFGIISGLFIATISIFVFQTMA